GYLRAQRWHGRPGHLIVAVDRKLCRAHPHSDCGIVFVRPRRGAGRHSFRARRPHRRWYDHIELARRAPRTMIGGGSPAPFPPRTAARNITNVWVTKGGFTVPACYLDAVPEALAARLTAALIDITPRQDLRIDGEGAAELLSASCGGAVTTLEVGQSSVVH